MMQRIKLLFLLKNPAFYRSLFLDELAKVFDLTVIFTMRPSEMTREPAYFREPVDVEYRSVYVSGVRLGKFKLATSWPAEAQEEYDCIIVGLLDDVIALQFIEFCRRHGKRYVLSFDGVGRRGQILDLIYGRYIKGALACLSPSRRTDEFIWELSSRAMPVRRYTLSSVLADDLDEEALGGDGKKSLRAALGIRSDNPVVLVVGQIIHRKGIDILVRSMARVSFPCTVVAVGGRVSSELQELIEQEGDQHAFVFVEYVSPEALVDYFRMADVFVLPTRGDSWGLVIVEAMAHGLPVITTTACGAGVELIDESVGLLVEPDDVSGLKEAIVTLLQDADGLEARSRASLHRAQECTIEAMSDACVRAVLEFSAKSSVDQGE